MKTGLKALTVWTNNGWRKVKGKFITLSNVPDVQVFVHKVLPKDKEFFNVFHVTEYTTGGQIAGGKTEKSAIENAIAKIDAEGVDKFNAQLKKHKRRGKYDDTNL